MKRNLIWLQVEPREAAVVHRNGTLVGTLGTGRHRIGLRDTVRCVDTGVRLTTISPQEVPTAEGLTVRVSLAIIWRVDDPVTHLDVATDPIDHVYLAVQVALRDVVATVPLEQVAATLRTDPNALVRITTAARVAAGQLGIHVDQVTVKDVILPAELRHAINQVVLAQHRGRARLEEARAETAALRAMANAAKLLDDHPALAKLRMVEAAGMGAKLVLHEP